MWKFHKRQNWGHSYDYHNFEATLTIDGEKVFLGGSDYFFECDVRELGLSTKSTSPTTGTITKRLSLLRPMKEGVFKE